MAQVPNCLFCLLQILTKETDEYHKLTTNQLIEKLSDYGISAHRNTISAEIKQLQNAGFDIVCDKSSRNSYFMGERTFALTELKVICDAINAAQFITEEQSAELINRLLKNQSKYQITKITEMVQQPINNKSQGKSIYSADVINTAIATGKKIHFQYYEYTGSGERILKHKGYTYTVSPYAAVWNSDRYYLVGYCERHEDITVFRIDRIANVRISDKNAVKCPKSFDLQAFLSRTIRMFKGEPAEVVLRCHDKHMKSIIDKFGSSITVNDTDDKFFTVKVNVELSPSFYGWLFQFDGEIALISPQSAVDEYCKKLKNMLVVHK